MLKPVEKIETPQPDPRFVTTDYSSVGKGDFVIVEREVRDPYTFRGLKRFWVPALVTRATKTQRAILCLGRETVVTLKGKIVGAGTYDRLQLLTEEGQREFDYLCSEYAYVRLTRLRDRIHQILTDGYSRESTLAGHLGNYLRRAANEGIVDEELMDAAERAIEILKQREQEPADEPK